MSVATRKHILSIDALRGFAALSVVLFHLGGPGLPKLGSSLTARLTGWGWTGVEVFFVISGFVIPYVMLKSDYHWRDYRSFLGRRFVRIWPPAAILITLTVIQFAVTNALGKGNPNGWTHLSAARIAANLTYAVPFTGQSWLSGVLWTLAVEFQFYVFLAIAFPLLRSDRGWLAIAALLALLTPFLPGAESAQFLKYAVFFAMGGVTMLYSENLIRWPWFFAVLTTMTVVATIELSLLPSLFAAAAAFAIAFIPIRNRVFMFLGTISYSLYLTHMLIASTSEFLAVHLFGPQTPMARGAVQLVCLGLTIFGAWVFYLFVERHFVELSRRLANASSATRIRRRGQVPAASKGL